MDDLAKVPNDELLSAFLRAGMKVGSDTAEDADHAHTSAMRAELLRRMQHYRPDLA